MGIVGTGFRVFWSRILPVIVIASALLIGWLARHELPEGLFFATIIPLIKGKLPPSIFGHGRMVGTIPVPTDLKPSPRPENEMFLQLPGGHLMPQNGLGMCCRPTAYDDELVRRTVLWYLLSGGRLIDGAHLYLNHKAIGEGIRNAMIRGIPRDEIFVTTKIFPRHFGYNTTKEIVPTFLEELGLDYIDLVLVHAPKTLPYMTTECSKLGLTQQECRAETWKSLSELRQEGIVRNVGVSNFAVKHLVEIEALNLAPIAANQFKYNPWAPDHAVETFEYCQKHNIAVTAYSSLAGAFQYSTAETVETLHDLAAKHNKTVAQIMLRWALQINAAVIPGTGNPKHMQENLNVYSFSLSKEDMSAIDRLRTDESAKKFFYMPPAD